MSDEAAPWEQPSPKAAARKSDRAAKVDSEPYKLPSDDKLPEVLKPDMGGMVASGDFSVPRPPVATPREVAPTASKAMTALIALTALGIVIVVIGFVVIPAELAVVRYGLDAMGALVALASLAVFLIESGRQTKYRNLTFFPAILCYGSTQAFTKYAGPAGVAGIGSTRIRGSGNGILNYVFDRSAHSAGAPEVVALLLDRGAGPELVGVDWEAVRQCQRGDIVWYHALSPTHFVFFHLMKPFAPALAPDRATKEEVFRALKVGKSMFKDFPKKEVAGAAMGKSTKVIKTDASGNIIAAQDERGQGREFVEGAPQDQGPELRVSALGASLGGDPYAQQPPGEESFDPPPETSSKRGYNAIDGATEYSPPPRDVGKFRIADPDKPLGGYGEQDQSGEA